MIEQSLLHTKSVTAPLPLSLPPSKSTSALLTLPPAAPRITTSPFPPSLRTSSWPCCPPAATKPFPAVIDVGAKGRAWATEDCLFFVFCYRGREKHEVFFEIDRREQRGGEKPFSRFRFSLSFSLTLLGAPLLPWASSKRTFLSLSEYRRVEQWRTTKS